MSTLTLNALLYLAVAASPTQSYEDAYKQAVNSDRPLVVLVGADWCPACQTMKQSVMPQLASSGQLDKVSFAIVNTDAQGSLASKIMSGNSIPQLVMYTKTADGWKRQQLTGGQSSSDVVQFLQRGMASSAKPVGVASGE